MREHANVVVSHADVATLEAAVRALYRARETKLATELAVFSLRVGGVLSAFHCEPDESCGMAADVIDNVVHLDGYSRRVPCA